jgi:hypothetical protein
MTSVALMRQALTSLTMISISTDAGTVVASYDESIGKIRLRTQLLQGREVCDDYTVSKIGGFALTSAAAILSKASKLLGASKGESAKVKVRVCVDGHNSEHEFPLPLRTTTIHQMKMFLDEIRQAHEYNAHARGRKSST